MEKLDLPILTTSFSPETTPGAKRFHLQRVFWAQAGHRLYGHTGKCGRLHGHSYRIEIGVRGFVAPPRYDEDQYMLVDFLALKRIFGHWLDEHLDHRFLVGPSDPLAEHITAEDGLVVCPYPPTAEGISRWLFEELSNLLITFVGNTKATMRLDVVSVRETQDCGVVYEG